MFEYVFDRIRATLQIEVLVHTEVVGLMAIAC